MTNAKRVVFLSHSSQHAAQAQAAAEILQEIGGEECEVFLSERIQFGSRWLSTIHDKLKSAAAFLLLIPEGAVDYSWCVFEAGIFAALNETLGTERPVLIVHPQNVDVPRPLTQYHKVEIKPGDIGPIRVLLRDLFPSAVLKNPGENPLNLLELFKKPALEFSTIFDKRIEITFSEEQLRSLQDANAMSEDVKVRGTGSSLEIFGFDEAIGEAHWGGILENLKPSAKDPQELWLTWPQHLPRILKTASQFTKGKKKAADGLPLYLDAWHDVVYRPSLFERIRLSDGGMKFFINFTRLPQELAARPERELGVITHLVEMCRLFRWGILDNKSYTILFDPDQDAASTEWIDAKAKLEMAFGNLICDFRNRVIKPFEIEKAFREGWFVKGRRKEVAKVLSESKSLGEKLYLALQSGSALAFINVFAEYRRVNKKLLVLSLEEYLHHARRLDQK